MAVSVCTFKPSSASKSTVFGSLTVGALNASKVTVRTAVSQGKVETVTERYETAKATLEETLGLPVTLIL